MAGMLYNKTVKFDSSAGKLAHSGFLTRADAIAESNVVYEYIQKICDEKGIKLSYDLSYDGFPNELIVTEAFGGHGGIVIHPAEDALTDQMLRDCGSGDRDIEFLKTKKDKYALFDAEYDVKKVVVLPGTNLLCRMSDKVIKGLNKPDVYFKPHPITTEFYIREVSSLVGPEKVLSKLASGAKIIEGADELWCSRSTELGLYAALDGKKVNTYPINYKNRGSYYVFYENIHRIAEVLSTPKSGVIFQNGDWKAQVDEYFEYYLEKRSSYKRKPVKAMAKGKKKNQRKSRRR